MVLFVITPTVLNRTRGMSYTPTDIICVSIGRIAPMAGYAPADATTEPSNPTILPFLSTPSLAVITKSRPWTSDTMSSDRVAVHLTGRPSFSAAAPATRCSGYTAAFGPKPPPTQGHTTRSFSGASPRSGAYAPWIECGAWCETQHVRLPSAGTARMPFVSIGTPARRWLTMVTSATLSAPTSGSTSPSSGKLVAKQTFEPCSSNSSGASGESASTALVTDGNAS